MMNYQDYIKPELLILIPVLYIMGLIVKSTEAIKNKYIPAILGLAGIALASLYVIATEGLDRHGLFSQQSRRASWQAGASVYNAVIDQLGGRERE